MKQLAKLSGKYQATIPASVRRALGLRPGDRLAFDLTGSEAHPIVTLRRCPTLDELAGTVPVPPEVRGLSWSEVRERAWTGAARRSSRRSSPR